MTGKDTLRIVAFTAGGLALVIGFGWLASLVIMLVILGMASGRETNRTDRLSVARSPRPSGYGPHGSCTCSPRFTLLRSDAMAPYNSHRFSCKGWRGGMERRKR